MLGAVVRRSARCRRRCGRRCGPGTPPAACAARPASKSANDMHRSSRLQSTNCTSAPGADRGQRRGHEGVRRAQHGLALDAGEVQRGQRAAGPARARPPPGASFQASQAASKRAIMSASDQRLESRTSSISACSRARSRWSNPIANAREVRERSVGKRKLKSCLGGRARARASTTLPPPAGGVDSRAQVANPASQCARWQACQTGRTVPSFRRLSSVDDQLERRDGAPVRVAGAVEVGVVQEDHVAGEHARACPRGDPPRRRELAPVLAPARPQQRPQARRPRRPQAGRAVDPVRRPVPDRARRRSRPRSRRSPRARSSRDLRRRSGAAGGGGGRRAAPPRGPPATISRHQLRAPAAPARRSRRTSRARPRARAPRAPPACPRGGGRRRRSAPRRRRRAACAGSVSARGGVGKTGASRWRITRG